MLHYARSGQLPGSFSDDLNLGCPVDVALDETRGRVLVADSYCRSEVAIESLIKGVV